MIKIVLRIPTMRRFPSVRSAPKDAFAVICLIARGDSVVYGIGIQYQDTEHLYFKETKTLDPYMLWRGMYAASKASCLSDELVRIAMAIADEGISINDPQFNDAERYIKYGYTPAILRLKTFEQVIPEDDIKKIVSEFKRFKVPINDPFEVLEPKKHLWGNFPRTNIGIKSLAMT